MTGFIMVAVDGSRHALQAVNWGTAEALRRRLPLRIVYIAPRREHDPQATRPESSGLHVLAAAAEHATMLAPDLPISTRLAVGSTTTLAAEAALLLLASDTTLSGTPGSLIRHTAEHARCPVIIVPPDHDTRPRRREVVVGIDGRTCQDVIAFAFEEAALRGVGLRAMHAWAQPFDPSVTDPDRYDEATVKRASGTLLSEALVGWPTKYPDVPIIEQVTLADPADALIEDSRTAELVVIGSHRGGRGHGHHFDTCLGSVGQTVLRRAQGPIAIARSAH